MIINIKLGKPINENQIPKSYPLSFLLSHLSPCDSELFSDPLVPFFLSGLLSDMVVPFVITAI